MNIDIGLKLKELRILKGLTQEELADRAELSKGFISQLERNLTSPSIATLTDILQCLGSTLSEFFYEPPEEQIVFGKSDYFEKYDPELKNNIKKYWWDSMVLLHENIVGIDSAIFMHPTIWKASGHVDAFNDPLIDNKDSKKRYRADVLIEDLIAKMDEKIEKEVEKAAKRFGESFDEALFRQTNPRVQEHVAKREELHSRYASCARLFSIMKSPVR